MSLQKEYVFFHDIAKQVLKLVAESSSKPKVANYKSKEGDYATEVDWAVENLIVAEIKKRFPGDAILAEEGYSDVTIPDGRIWIIDPICGTSNVGRGLPSYCTNIALADKKKLIASCVVDFSHNEYFWSVGNNQLFINDRLHEPMVNEVQFGRVIDIDLGALYKVNKSVKKSHFEACYGLSLHEEFAQISLRSSLGFAYTATGRIDGFINVKSDPWDICASAFLIQQSGGKITDIKGDPWEITSEGAIGAITADLHKKLLDIYTAK